MVNSSKPILPVTRHERYLTKHQKHYVLDSDTSSDSEHNKFDPNDDALAYSPDALMLAHGVISRKKTHVAATNYPRTKNKYNSTEITTYGIES